MKLDNTQMIKILKAYNRHRLIITTLVLGITIIINYFWIAFPVRPIMILTLISYIGGIICIFLIKYERVLLLLLYLSRIFDFFLILACIYVTGGIESFLTPLVFFYILACGIVSGLRVTMVITTIIIFSYTFFILLEYLGIIPHRHVVPIVGCIYDSNFYTFCLLGLNSAFFYVTVFISGYLGKVIREKISELDKSKSREKFTKDFLENIINNMADGLIVTDVDLKIQMVNSVAQQMLGHTDGEMLNKSIIEFIQDEKLPTLLKEAIIENHLTEEEIEITNPATHKKEILTLKMTSLKNSHNKVMGVVIVSRDVTSEELLARMRSNFLSLISHELRTPLSSIKAYTETLLDGEETPEEEKEFLEIINSESDALTREINQILMLSELDIKHIPLRKRAINLSQLVAELIDHLKPEEQTRLEKIAKDKKIKLIVNIPKDLPQIFGDYHKIKTAVEHLIENGIKFTPAGGEVKIAAERSGDEIKVCVSDTGQGISRDKLDEIFTPFYQLESPMTRETKGMGLGLTLVKHIIETHGGKIWVESEPGKGSSFIFTLPKE
ncbi:MAG: ATP-binding protein [bacterium]